MAIVRAVKSGVWSDPTVWAPSPPTSADDVYSNTFTVTIDISPTVLSISNAAATGVTAGGSFVPTNGITLTCTGAGVVSGGGHCFVSSLTLGQSCTLVSNVTGPLSSSGFCGARNQSTGTINIVGNCTVAGIGYGVENTSTGIVNITGSCTGGTGTSSHGAILSGNGQLNITGNCNGGSGTLAYGAFNNGTNGTLNITGTVTAGTGGFGAINSSTSGIMSVAGVCQASTSLPAIGGGSIGQVTTLTGPLISSDGSGGTAAASGVNPCVAVRWFPADTALSTFEYRMRGATAGGSPSVRPARQLFLTDAYSATYPTAANVRSATTYGPGNIYTGTCAVPPAGSVALGVPVDATTGTAALTAADIRSAVGLSSASLDTQLSGLSSGQTTINNNVSTRLASSAYTAPLDATGTRTALGLASANLDTQFSNIPANVRTNLSTELGRIDTTVSSRLATSGYTTPPTVGDIATAVWSAATSVLSSLGSIGKLLVDNINASISSRLASASYTAPPTATENASAVRTELAPELARIDVATSTRSTFNPSTDTVANVTLVATTTNLTNPPDVPTTTEIADAVRIELTPELDRIDTTVSSRSTFDPATDTVAQVALVDTTTNLTNPPVVPTTTEIADAVRVELTPELDRIDADVSSRLAAVDYTTAPTSEENAEAVRNELTPELDRIANCATVATTGEQIQDAWARTPNIP
jgi:hypothetical protein